MPVTGPAGREGPLAQRYDRRDLAVLTPAERDRFLAPGAWEDGGGGELPEGLVWQLLYRLEPELYDRLARAERFHPGVLGWLPERVEHAVEVGAGSGRLTLALAPRCGALIAVEPAAALRALLLRRVVAAGACNVAVCAGFVDRLPARSGSADLVVAASAFTPERAHGGDAGLAELERVAAPGGLVVIVWPNHLDWLRERGYAHVSFPGEMALEFESLDEALEVAAVFHPRALDEIRRRGSARVPYELAGRNAPRDLAWRRIPG